VALRRAETRSHVPDAARVCRLTREPLKDAQGGPQRDSKGKKVFGPETVVRNDDGSPVVRAEPIITREVLDRLASSWPTGKIGRNRPSAALHCYSKSSTAVSAFGPHTGSKAVGGGIPDTVVLQPSTRNHAVTDQYPSLTQTSS